MGEAVDTILTYPTRCHSCKRADRHVDGHWLESYPISSLFERAENLIILDISRFYK